MPVVECFESCQPVSRRAHIVTSRLEARAKHTRQLRLIVYDQNLRRTIHCFQCDSTSSSPIGSVNTTRVPLPPAPDSIQIFPSCASTIPLAIARPMPVPVG